MSYPAYATVTPSGNSTYTWAGSTSDPRALQKPSSATDRIAACWYTSGGSSSTVDINLTDGKTHQLAVYALDWDAFGPRQETIQIADSASGTVLDSESAPAFQNGQYFVWAVQGHVQLRVINTNPASNAVISGLFFDPANIGGGTAASGSNGTTTSGSGGTTTSGSNGPTTSGTAPAAVFVKSDTVTQGNWKGVYGSDGFNTIDDTVQYPAYVTVSNGGAPVYDWENSTTQSRALQKASSSSDRIAACWYSPSNQTSFSIDLNIKDGNAHQLALYALDWDSYGGTRADKIQIVDPATGNVLDTESITSFQNGEYLVWTIQGHVQAIVTTNNPNTNSVISGLFFDPVQSGTTGGTTTGGTTPAALFVASDTTTQGNWKGVYGSGGFNVIDDTAQYPAYVTVSNGGAPTYDWENSTTQGRALQKASSSSDRIAACWYSASNQTSFTIDLNITDGNAHQFALYALDWDSYGGPRGDNIQIIDPASGKVLDTESITSFQNGEYLIWTIRGHVQAVVTTTNPNSNAVVSGLFFDAPGTSGTAREQLQVSSTGAFISSGTMGGPFTPGSDTYALSNSGTSSVNWSASATQSWLSLSASGGTLSGSGSSTVTASINAKASGLVSGTYTDTITFTDLGTAATQTEPVTLTVAPPPPPAITSPLTATATSGVAFSYQIAASNSPRASARAVSRPGSMSTRSASSAAPRRPPAQATSPSRPATPAVRDRHAGAYRAAASASHHQLAHGQCNLRRRIQLPDYGERLFHELSASGLPPGLNVNSLGLISGSRRPPAQAISPSRPATPAVRDRHAGTDRAAASASHHQLAHGQCNLRRRIRLPDYGEQFSTASARAVSRPRAQCQLARPHQRLHDGHRHKQHHLHGRQRRRFRDCHAGTDRAAASASHHQLAHGQCNLRRRIQLPDYGEQFSHELQRERSPARAQCQLARPHQRYSDGHRYKRRHDHCR